LRFEQYHRAESIEHCLELKAEYGTSALILAGGTDLLPRMNQGLIAPKAVIDISFISKLSGIKREEGGVFIGAATRLSDLRFSEGLSGAHRVVGEGASQVSSMQVRNVATLGGNCCNASPSADTIPALVLLDAKVRIASKTGEREIPVRDFMLGPGKTDLKADELVIGFSISDVKHRAGVSYRKFSIRGTGDISIVGAGALIGIDESGTIQKVRIALASVGPTVVSCDNTSSLLEGFRPSQKLFEEAAMRCVQECSPIDDQRASAWYRRKIVSETVQKALEAAYKNHEKGGGIEADR
jgi:carbon-monoxide dehydrogenase medium subunit